jgi:DNA repair exonuclease SbcCD nuclease subunit
MIVAADLHLRSDVPRCRAETETEWLMFQSYCLDLIMQHDEPIFIAGDIFDKARVHDRVVSMFIGSLRGNSKVAIMPGNHDMEYRSPNMLNTSYGILDTLCGISDTLYSIETFHNMLPYGKTTKEDIKGDTISDILFLHTLTFEKEDDVPFGVKHYDTAESLLRKYPHKIIVVGDMHKPWAVKKGNRLVINCGSMTIQSVNEADYTHGYWKVNEDTLQHSFHELPKGRIVEDKFLEKQAAKDERITAFVESLKGKETITLDFFQNVKNRLTKVGNNTINKKVMEWFTEGGAE